MGIRGFCCPRLTAATHVPNVCVALNTGGCLRVRELSKPWSMPAQLLVGAAAAYAISVQPASALNIGDAAVYIGGVPFTELAVQAPSAYVAPLSEEKAEVLGKVEIVAGVAAVASVAFFTNLNNKRISEARSKPPGKRIQKGKSKLSQRK